MVTIYYDKDADLNLLKGKTVGIIGYGSQGHAHSQNLRDSGVKVVVGLYNGSKSWEKARKDGLDVALVSDVAREADIVMMLIPDHLQAKTYKESIEQHMKPGKMLMFAHGFTIHYKTIVPPAGVDVAMVAPKAPGHRVRELFKENVGVPALLAIHQDPSGKGKPLAMAYGKGIGVTKAGLVETSFKNETETDLFGEQSVLCGGVTRLIQMGFETLVEAGYPPELAYFECLHEMKLIVDLIYQGGFTYMRHSVSDTAEYGDYSRGSVVVDDHVKENMKRVLKQVQDGSFAKEWIAENAEGRHRFLRMRKDARAHQIEEVGKELRKMMPFMHPVEIPE